MKKTLILLLVALLSLSACDTTEPAEEGNANVTLMIEAAVNGTAFNTDTSTVYTTNNRDIRFTSGRIYVSNVTFIAEDGTEILIEDTPLTLPAQNDQQETVNHTVTERIALLKHEMGMAMSGLGDVPAGRYAGIKFDIGLRGMTNKVDPTSAPADHVLAKQLDQNNHWSWNNGYIFMRIEGKVDTTAAGNGTATTPWRVHLGMGSFLKNVEINEPFTLEEGDQMVHLMLNYGKMIEDIDFSDPAQLDCITMNNMPVANKVFADIQDAFTLHGVHSH